MFSLRRRRLLVIVGAAGLLSSAMAAVGASTATGSAAAAVAPCPSPATLTGSLCTQTFTYTGAEQTFTVPAGVMGVHVVAVGAAGGMGFQHTRLHPPVGGLGAKVSANLTGLTPNQKFFVEVGGAPRCNAYPCPGGFNGGGTDLANHGGGGGGGGGGASDIRTVTSGNSASLDSRRIVAAGGGGSGPDGGCFISPDPSSPDFPYEFGGRGGDAGAAGYFGFLCPLGTGGPGGGAGTQTAGGARGFPRGEPGQKGVGGSTDSEGGGGGGGGLYGGGSGDHISRQSGGGGGGGGSNLVPAGGSASLNSGPPQVVISWDPPLHITNMTAITALRVATVTVAFTDDDPNGNLSQYSGTIVWGDGSTTSIPKLLFIQIGRSISTTALHTYTKGLYTVTVTIKDVDGAAAIHTATIRIPN